MEAVNVTDYLAHGYVRDGSVSYQAELQQAIDAAEEGRMVLFPPMRYRLDENGLRVHSHLTLWMYGATFQLARDCAADGQAFLGQGIADVRFLGGEIVGRNDLWPLGANIRGIYLTGSTRDVRICDMHIHAITSNAVGVFGKADDPAHDIWITDCVLEDGCNWYGDYLSQRPGPEPGSVRQDQGLIALYHVQDFVVRGCRLERSRSDATHFYRCRRGEFVDNKVYGAQMGGYFLETCAEVTASDNIVRDNGSRGVTIERGSQSCILQGNLVASSGREGLWAPDCTGLVITGNIFDRNGRKPNGNQPGQIWNANITIDDARHDPTHSPTQDYLVANNILYTAADQVAAIRIDAGVSRDIIVRGNLLRGENRRILVEGDSPEALSGNDIQQTP
ncbi:MAG: right-handed parallel beta-helix repeat-containing protein [Chloroflexi bacterium]|nr:right-handed parallel beta-helix repeat-containing protein [Chloroflexota bacterium]